jgi:YrbI family 3-deoxy-D-manno-octulosonate 8-phosphate phosphatase
VRLIVFDFDGVFTDNAVWVLEDGRELVRCWRGDGLGLAELRRLDIHLLILSTERNPVVSERAKKLQTECVQDCADKLATLQEILQRHALSPAAVAYVGNDINDASCLQFVGVPVVVADAHEDVLPLARFRTRRTGGHGAVREVADWFRAAYSRSQ